MMKTIKSIYKIGNGPSSSHTVGPYNAAGIIKERYPDKKIRVTLYGSLAYTGDGHGTKKAIQSVLPEAEVFSDGTKTDLPHPNTMEFEILNESGECAELVRIFSIGGGSIRIEGEVSKDEKEIYNENSFSSIASYCKENECSLLDYIHEREDDDLDEYLLKIWKAMEESVERGLSASGTLPGQLKLSRKAALLKDKRCYNESPDITMNRLVASYAYAVSEENADEHIVVTAPTCGSCGVLPSVLYYMCHDRGFPEHEIIDALKIAGLFGNLIRTNASISGAECGCQAEIGSACSMTAAAVAQLFGLGISQMEYAAESAMEHNLGLTCDPICGLVQIPCIERNAVAAMRSLSSVNLSYFLSETRKISFDEVVETMYRTGLDMDNKYKETAHGGLAAIYRGSL